MKVLWLVRRDLEEHLGGDTIQILSTAEKLRERGHTIELCADTHPDLGVGEFDLVHLFHLDRLWENLPHLRRLKAQRRPVVLSPIWWPTDEYDARGREGVQGWISRTFGARTYPTLKVLQRSLPPWLRGGLRPSSRPPLSFGCGARELLDGVSVVLPNSRAEASAIKRRFGWTGEVVVVPNAADSTYFVPREDALRQGIVCVGRIEPRKNQLTLIEALRGLGVPLVLIGKAGRFARGYEERCRAAAGDGVEFTGPLDRAGVRERLQSALVHVCPSWYETPGLASLEAALCGCRIVVTPGGSTQECLGDAAWFGSAEDPATLRAAVDSALAGPPKAGARERIARKFSWERAAAATELGYEVARAASPHASDSFSASSSQP